MTRAPTSQAERYLDAARTLGVSDAALRRHLAVGADASLQATLADRLAAPTDELLDLLAAAGVVLDLDAVDPEETEALRCCLARFGFAAECAAVAGELEVVAADLVADDVRHVRVEPTADRVRSALKERLFDDVDVRVVPLVDDRVLVAETRALAALQDRYGDRLEVFETPLLAGDVGSVDAPNATSSVGSVADAATHDAADGRADEADARRAAGTERADLLVDEETSFGDVLAAADEETTSAIESALAEGGPRVHTADAETETGAEANAADGDGSADAAVGGSADAAGSGSADDARPSEVGGGPRRTVSSSGIDQVFEQLEATADAGGASGGAVAASSDAGPDAASAGSQDSLSDATGDDASASDSLSDDGDCSDDASDGTVVGGGPTRTVSETSADDILERVAGDDDFEELADEQGEADPEAVLDESESIPGVETDEAQRAGADDGSDADDAGNAGDAANEGVDATSVDVDGTSEGIDAGRAESDDSVADDEAPDLAGRVEDALDAATDDAPRADAPATDDGPRANAPGPDADDAGIDADGVVPDADATTPDADATAPDADDAGSDVDHAEPDANDAAQDAGPQRTTASDGDDVEDAADALAEAFEPDAAAGAPSEAAERSEATTDGDERVERDASVDEQSSALADLDPDSELEVAEDVLASEDGADGTTSADGTEDAPVDDGSQGTGIDDGARGAEPSTGSAAPSVVDVEAPDDVGEESSDVPATDSPVSSGEDPSDATSGDSTEDASSDGPALGDALVGDDVEVRRGTETVATGADAVDVERSSDAGRPETDGPLARAGGVSPSAGGDDSRSADGDESEDDGDDSPSLLERVRSVFRR